MSATRWMSVCVIGALAASAGCSAGTPTGTVSAPIPAAPAAPTADRHVMAAVGPLTVRPDLPASISVADAARVLVQLANIQIAQPSGTYSVMAIHNARGS